MRTAIASLHLMILIHWPGIKHVNKEVILPYLHVWSRNGIQNIKGRDLFHMGGLAFTFLKKKKKYFWHLEGRGAAHSRLPAACQINDQMKCAVAGRCSKCYSHKGLYAYTYAPNAAHVLPSPNKNNIFRLYKPNCLCRWGLNMNTKKVVFTEWLVAMAVCVYTRV